MARAIKQTRITLILLVTLVFILGVFFGNTYASFRENQISKVLQQSELDAESFLTEQELFDNFETNCPLAEKRLSTLSQELWKLGKTLDTPDARDKLGEETYNVLKIKYHLMQIRTYILDKKLKEDCQSQINVILYYFKQNDPQSTTQGKILDNIANKYNVHIFAIEHDYSKEIRFLEQYYEITTTPALVINYDSILTGITQEHEIEQLLHG